jgi:hypothetical protein
MLLPSGRFSPAPVIQELNVGEDSVLIVTIVLFRAYPRFKLPVHARLSGKPKFADSSSVFEPLKNPLPPPIPCE